MTALVLYSDIVGFSMLGWTEQRRALDQLNALVPELESFRRHEEHGGAFLRDSGDGVALLFMSPVRYVFACTKALATPGKAETPTAFGLHTGTFDPDILDHHGQTKGTGDAIVNAAFLSQQRRIPCGRTTSPNGCETECEP